MKIFRGLPIYVLAIALVVSSLILSSKKEAEAPKGVPDFVTNEKYKADMKLMATKVIELQFKVSELESCLSDTTRNLTMRIPVSRWCPYPN